MISGESMMDEAKKADQFRYFFQRGGNTLITAGIDIGSSSTEVVIINGQSIVGSVTCDTGSLPRKAGTRAFEDALRQFGIDRQDIAAIIATGYGRSTVAFANKTVSEISCHARGAHFLDPSIELVIDIGGQDSKVMLLDPNGTVIEFSLNDKCAAGTGRFLEKMALILDTDVEGLSCLGITDEPIIISSTCAVFAETEVVSLLASEISSSRIAAGIHKSIADRIAAMIMKVGRRPRAFFTGGVAQSNAVRLAIEKATGIELTVPPQPQIIGALGAAVYAQNVKTHATTPKET
jgi:predicted CoA-substrate-specific enzyme activase